MYVTNTYDYLGKWVALGQPSYSLPPSSAGPAKFSEKKCRGEPQDLTECCDPCRRPWAGTRPTPTMCNENKILVPTRIGA